MSLRYELMGSVDSERNLDLVALKYDAVALIDHVASMRRCLDQCDDRRFRSSLSRANEIALRMAIETMNEMVRCQIVPNGFMVAPNEYGQEPNG